MNNHDITYRGKVGEFQIEAFNSYGEPIRDWNGDVESSDNVFVESFFYFVCRALGKIYTFSTLENSPVAPPVENDTSDIEIEKVDLTGYAKVIASTSASGSSLANNTLHVQYE
jgi:hypothetical protein